MKECWQGALAETSQLVRNHQLYCFRECSRDMGYRFAPSIATASCILLMWPPTVFIPPSPPNFYKGKCSNTVVGERRTRFLAKIWTISPPQISTPKINTDDLHTSARNYVLFHSEPHCEMVVSHFNPSESSARILDCLPSSHTVRWFESFSEFLMQKR